MVLLCRGLVVTAKVTAMITDMGVAVGNRLHSLFEVDMRF